ncbi:unnamed protein product [Alternaria alternata]
MASMKAVGVSTYGPVDNFQSRDIPKPGEPTDTKIRGGTYDDAPDYYEHAPQGFHVIGYDGAGTVLEVGPDVTRFKVGDDISWVGATTRQGSYAEYQLVSEFLCCKKPENLDFVEAASYGLTFGTAYQSLNHRLEIKPNEDAGILIIRRYKLTLENLKQAHRQIESKATIGKIGLGVEEPGEGTPFA